MILGLLTAGGTPDMCTKNTRVSKCMEEMVQKSVAQQLAFIKYRELECKRSRPTYIQSSNAFIYPTHAQRYDHPQPVAAADDVAR